MELSKYNKRVVIWFSCGVTSAVASYLTVKKFKGVLPIEIYYCNTGSEHPDNKRFLLDVEKWIGHPIKVLLSEYYDHFDVIRKTKVISIHHYAPCTLKLKKQQRDKVEQFGDVQVFGFDIDEIKRAERFKEMNKDTFPYFPLIENNLSKADCKSIILEAGIELPYMYKLGFKHNNCVGCIKGKKGYWNKIKKHFPETFEKMAQIEEEIGHTVLKDKPLRELKEDEGWDENETEISCSIYCGEIMKEL